MSSKVCNKFRFLLATKAVNMSGDTFKIILMQYGFVFNEDTHEKYADIIASEVALGSGYTTGGNTLTGVTLTPNSVDDRLDITWANASWTASGADVGPICGAIIYDDTVSSPIADPIVGFIDFEGSFTEPDGGTATIANIKLRV